MYKQEFCAIELAFHDSTQSYQNNKECITQSLQIIRSPGYRIYLFHRLLVWIKADNKATLFALCYFIIFC